MTHKTFSITLDPATNNIDQANGIIKGVSILTVGDAKGHGLKVDNTTLEQVKTAAEAFQNGVKVKMGHGSGVDAIVGRLTNFRIFENKLVGDLYLLKSHPDFGFIIELAATLGDTFGLSVAFNGVDEQGQDGLFFARCDELFSVDIVSEPAANPSGLFSAVDTKQTSKQDNIMPEDQKPQVHPIDMLGQKIDAFMSRLERLEAMFPAKEEEKPSEKAPKVEVEVEKEEELACSGKEKEMSSKLDDIRKEFNEKVEKILSAVCAKAPVSTAPIAPAKIEDEPKTFEAIVQAKRKEGMSQIDAIKFSAKSKPELYLEARARGINFQNL